MKKLNKYIQIETQNGFKIIKAFSPSHGPGAANYERNCVVLNSLFIYGNDTSFDENVLIGVLYHEIGHLKYFKKYPVTKENFTDEYKTNSEFFAFENSLIELQKIANNGDSTPLKATYEKLNERITKVLNNDFSDEDNSKSHIDALIRLSKSKTFQRCDCYLKKNNY